MQQVFRATVLGAQYFDIKDEATGVVKRWSKLYILEPFPAGQNDRAGLQPKSLSAYEGAIVEKVRSLRVPCLCDLTCELSINSKGMGKPIVHAIQPVEKGA